MQEEKKNETSTGSTEEQVPQEDSSESISLESCDDISIQLSEANEKLLRARAEMENMSKRFEREAEESAKYSISRFARSMLPVADNLDMAMDAVKKMGESNQGIIDGIKITRSELEKVFLQFGIQKMDAVGNIFDPNLHQVMQEEEVEGQESGKITSIMQNGYMIKDRVLRAALVKTVK